MNKPVGGNVNLRQKVAIHKKVPLLICPTTISDMGAHQQNKPGDLSLYRTNAKFQSISNSKQPVHSVNAYGKANYPIV